MSTVVVVKKNGFVSIAADTLTTNGSSKESAVYVVNHQKTIEYDSNYLGITGSASLGMAIGDFLSKQKKKVSLESVSDIFRFGLLLHKDLKENYFLRPDDEDDFETFRGDILIANKNGIFGLSSYRFVQEYAKFYANGSGAEYALGAMFAIYEDENKTAEDIATIGVNAGIEFDDGSGSPITCYTLKLKEK
jgi:ATP-dependent HslUV protease, peptidase subunit HslV